MKIFKIPVFCLVICATATAQTYTYNIVPKPAKLKAQPGHFFFNSETRIVAPVDNYADMYNAVLRCQSDCFFPPG